MKILLGRKKIFLGRNIFRWDDRTNPAGIRKSLVKLYTAAHVHLVVVQVTNLQKRIEERVSLILEIVSYKYCEGSYGDFKVVVHTLLAKAKSRRMGTLLGLWSTSSTSSTSS